MRELKILAVVVFFTIITYIGVEPFAHSQMHKHIEPVDYKYSDLKPLNKKGDAKKGAETFMNAGCVGCHGVKSQGIAAPMDAKSASASFGVVPPDLSNAGSVFDEKFLANLIKNPAHALMLEHKFNDKRPFPMTPFMGLGGDLDQEVADIVAYLKSIAPKKLDDKDVFITACGRCHNVKYDGWKRPSDTEALKKYMGKNPPDLSIIIRAKSKEHLINFIGEPVFEPQLFQFQVVFHKFQLFFKCGCQFTGMGKHGTQYVTEFYQETVSRFILPVQDAC